MSNYCEYCGYDFIDSARNCAFVDCPSKYITASTNVVGCNERSVKSSTSNYLYLLGQFKEFVDQVKNRSQLMVNSYEWGCQKTIMLKDFEDLSEMFLNKINKKE